MADEFEESPESMNRSEVTEGLMIKSSGDQPSTFPPFEFPNPPLPCRVTLCVTRYGVRRLDRAMDRAKAVASQMGCDLFHVIVTPEGACSESAHGVFWAMVPKDVGDLPQDTDGARDWFAGLVRVESRLLADGATTLRALNVVTREGRRALAERGG